MSAFARRAAFALAFLDYNLVGSGAINDDSQMLWVRDVRGPREEAGAVLVLRRRSVSGRRRRRVQWVIDAYTTTVALPVRPADRQHRAHGQLRAPARLELRPQQREGGRRRLHGDVTFYVVDDADPILQAWRGRVPRPVHPDRRDARRAARAPALSRGPVPGPDRPLLQVPAGARELLPARRRVVGRAGAERRATAVDRRIAGDPADETAATEFATESQAARFVPYYTMFRNGVTGEEEFVMLRPFVPFSRNDRRTELQAYMTASSDPQTYGRLSYVVAGRASSRAAARRRPGRVGAADQPRDLVAGQRGERYAGALRRHAAGADRRRAGVRSAVLHRGPAAGPDPAW